jgi:hypothetical protein
MGRTGCLHAGPGRPTVPSDSAAAAHLGGTLAAPGKVCVIRRAMPGAPDANALWEHFRDYWIRNWGWAQVLSEPSMFIQEVGPGQYERMEADNDDFLITAPTEDHKDRLARPLEDTWKKTQQKLSTRTTIQSKERPTTNAADTTTGDPSALQHVSLWI